MGKQKGTQPHRQFKTKIDRQTGWKDRQPVSFIYRQASKQCGKHTDRRTDVKTDGREEMEERGKFKDTDRDRQTYSQTDNVDGQRETTEKKQTERHV